MVGTPLMSVILPVYNRDRPLRRAIASVLRQTLRDFECIVIDDASDIDVCAIVASFADERLRYVRRATNGGPNGARFTGFGAARGMYVLLLDSDWELYPWTLAQAQCYLDETPAVDMVCGLHVRNQDSRLFVRVCDAPVVVTPDVARREPPIPDRVVAVRRCVLDEWLEQCPDYFDLAAHLFVTAKLRHSQLYVDEPWTIYHVDGNDRVTTSGPVERTLDDLQRFMEEHSALIDDQSEYLLLDEMLKDAYFALWRHRRPEATRVARYLRLRSITPAQVLLDRAWRKGMARLNRFSDTRVTWVSVPK
jgi:glycosyltransferase involved in cell wall biosynthesis